MIKLVTKQDSFYFYLYNRLANATPKVKFNEVEIQYNLNPKYLEIHLDRTLSYKFHLIKTASKVRTRNNINLKAGWLKLESFSRDVTYICFSISIPCCRILLQCMDIQLSLKIAVSCYSKLIDVQLSNTMRNRHIKSYKNYMAACFM